MVKWQGSHRRSPENLAHQAPSDDRICDGVSRAIWEPWGKVYADGLEFLHQHQDLPGRRTPSVDELLQEAEQQRALYEPMFGLRIVPERPHQYAFALVLRPFSQPALNVSAAKNSGRSSLVRLALAGASLHSTRLQPFRINPRLSAIITA
jgi:hypothetical protein